MKFTLTLFTLLLALPAFAGEPEKISFDRDIRPILSDNCFHCHGFDPKTRDADLRLDTLEGATRDLGGYAAILPKNAKASEAIKRIFSKDPDEVMPPPKSHLKLTEKEKNLLKRWINEGAEYEKHWAFESIKKPKLPKNVNPVDYFIKKKLSATKLKMNPPASSSALGRRLAMDLTGVPLSTARDELFQKENQTNPALAVEKLTNELFQSPQYGERMAWEWMEVSRYADTNGYQGDAERTMWMWRDWVIGAFQQNMPWDKFTIWQLAGDLLPDPTKEQLIATAFNRNFPINGEGGRIAEENRVEYVFDMTETMGTTWLGLTLECSRCHDHKFDAISQKDYYSLTSFFNQTPIDGASKSGQAPPVLSFATKKENAKIEISRKEIAEIKQVLKNIDQKDPKRKAIEQKRRDKSKALNKLTSNIPKLMIMRDQEKKRSTYILKTGLYNQRGKEVDTAIPKVFGKLGKEQPKNRLSLAQWLVNNNNPLTPRVTVNRLWQQFFGTGLVKTSEDFGVQGERPSHPQLLDWLAAEFVDSGWDVQHIIRLIVTSKTYQQSAKVTRLHLEHDSKNRLLARSPRYRLPSWMLRDHALKTSGLLVQKIGGKPVKPFQPEGIWKEATFGLKKYEKDKGGDLYRRTIYTFWRRISGPPALFDSADRLVCDVLPSRTNTPLNALTTMNDLGFVEAARFLAQNTQSIEKMFLTIVNRQPTADEKKLLENRMKILLSYYNKNPEKAKKLISVGDAPLPQKYNPVNLAARTSIANLLYNLDEVLCRS